MARLPGLLSAVIAALGLSGCLLFTDPINKAPSVRFVDLPATVYRGVASTFRASVSDDRDEPSTFQVRWGEFAVGEDLGCSGVTSASWTNLWTAESLPRPSTDPYLLTAKDIEPICLCLLATDRNRASTVACQKVQPINPAPVITDVAGASPGAEVDLCSAVHLSAESARYATTHQLVFNWSIDYKDGPDPAKGHAVTLVPCTSMPDHDDHRCFDARAQGTYFVTLTVSDIVTATGVKSTSDPATFEVRVKADRPPCILQTEPKVDADRVIIARRTDLGSSYESRTFQVLRADDDCESLPAVGSRRPTQFLWSILTLDPLQPSAVWSYQTNNTEAFTINRPNARPGDTIKLRVEARDSLSEKNGGATCNDSVGICCGAAECTGSPPVGCVRWTTWTVQFQP